MVAGSKGALGESHLWRRREAAGRMTEPSSSSSTAGAGVPGSSNDSGPTLVIYRTAPPPSSRRRCWLLSVRGNAMHCRPCSRPCSLVPAVTHMRSSLSDPVTRWPGLPADDMRRHQSTARVPPTQETDDIGQEAKTRPARPEVACLASCRQPRLATWLGRSVGESRRCSKDPPTP